MTVLSAQTIERLARSHAMISPFIGRTRQYGVTYGLSAAGYDVRVEFDSNGQVLERTINSRARGGFLLASTMERFKMPKNVIGIVHDKSTWARRGLTVQNTVIEPGWEGWLTLELLNHSNRMIKLRRGIGIAQVVFHFLDDATHGPYEGKYQNQERGPVAARSDDEQSE